jgi:hypothetical protein
MIKIQFEDGTILDKSRLEGEDIDNDEKASPTVEERIIPITREWRSYEAFIHFFG